MEMNATVLLTTPLFSPNAFPCIARHTVHRGIEHSHHCSGMGGEAGSGPSVAHVMVWALSIPISPTS